jgi:peptidoglycan/LPS O-acetylase OafA/YrhL
MKNAEFWASLLLAIVAAFVIAIWVPGQADQKVVHAIEYAGLVITFLFGFMILAAIASGKINISRILEEKGSADGGASMSRFQLLIFTFVVAISLLLIVVNKHDFPDQIPAGVLTLLGISASTYAVSKGIQTGADNGNGNGAPTPPSSAGVTHTTVVAPPSGGGSVTHTTVVNPPANAG